MRKGFTLIELIVVIAIIAILAAIIAPNAFKAIEKASRSATIGDFRAIKTAAMSLYADTGIWPISGCDAVFMSNRLSATSCAVATAASSISGWDGPYLEQWPSRTRWGGIYNITNNDDILWSGSDNTATAADVQDLGRYLTMNGTPVDVLARLDTQIDGEPSGTNLGNLTGQHRYSTNEYMLISTDAAVLN
ncbi:MAG: prepilin-type N-terminal cleavage/methylation domain-containing protein [Candidatus Omnitrophica bacterium]|nr:prepilin-type N-terminal cleavage/methylation domain-containing protein [Candidatus Omnitrophota bacterium]